MRTLLPRLALLLTLLSSALTAGACGASGPRLYSGQARFEDTRVQLTPAERERLDDGLCARFDAHEHRFPVRVYFTVPPSQEELMELNLVPYEHAALGRVDRQMLKRIAGRSDVSHIALVAVAQLRDSDT